ncbi:MAG: hypothetical protein BM563_07760 [Bacteroidetes bacterium MedPE-SWsnd-G1]|nr:MAG: hypothetical protein BM563_07760 [Bacteroidetes bacterium MedPE-SWsnd-G1]
MIKSFKYICIALTALIFVSCDQYPSLQKYFVDSQGSSEFIALDIPASIVSLKEEDASEETIETLKSIKKINFLGYQITEENTEAYKAEQQKVKEILKNPKYEDLIRLGGEGKTLVVKFLGEEDAIDEVIFYGADKELGFALVRVLGDDMEPAKMMELAQQVNIDDDSASIQQITSFMKNVSE